MLGLTNVIKRTLVQTMNMTAERIENWRKGYKPAHRRDFGWKEISVDSAELVVVECPGCGYHMGVDYTYLEQIGPVDIVCPSCETTGTVEEIL